VALDAEKVALLFGTVPPWADPDDPDDRHVLFSAGFSRHDRPGAFELSLQEILANQIAEDDPPQTWQTARRLLATGLDRAEVLRNLGLAAREPAIAGLRGSAFDPSAYRAALDRLPLPQPEELEALFVAIVREQQPIDVEELERLVGLKLGIDWDEEPYNTLLDVESDRFFDTDGPLELLAGDRVVEAASLCSAVVLTHRLTADEQTTDELQVDVDLVGFVRRTGPIPTNLGCELTVRDTGPDKVVWAGPSGWLERFPAGAVLAVRAAGDGVAIELVEQEPTADPSLVRVLREVYDREVEEPGLPVHTEVLLLGMLADAPGAFRSPQLPLAELCEAAGLELRGHQAAHDESVWAQERLGHSIARIMDSLEDRDDQAVALGALACFADRTSDPVRLQQALAALGDPFLLPIVADELLGWDEDAERLGDVAAFSERLLGVARRPQDTAVARWIAAVAAERRGDVLAAEAHLEVALAADGRWEPAVDRLAWYRSDRGDAPGALQLWQRLGVGVDAVDDIAILQSFGRPPDMKLGRNEPCWCGSGRKFKACHLDQPATAPLPDRVGWLWRKAAAYMQRRGGAAAPDVYQLAIVGATHPDDAEDAVAGAFGDPLVVDLALHELGWFERFLAERGPLLPEDEALLGASWALVDRTVYEVVETRPGRGMVVQDLRSAERLEVRERTFSHEARPGMLLCGRAVPDGETHQFLAGMLTVPAGRETQFLDLLDGGDPFDLLEDVRALQRPPALATREGEPLVVCEAVVEVPDVVAARTALDQRYARVAADEWSEVHDLPTGDNVVRAALHLDGDRITVDTMSEARVDRVLEALLPAIAGARVVKDHRRRFDPRDSPDGPPPVPLDDPRLQSVAEEWIERQERSWCDESIPALGGLTPRQAVADPTRRETVERLLADFDAMDARMPEGAVAMRPARLRSLLGLDA
jgi:SEC-C motif-containing protein